MGDRSDRHRPPPAVICDVGGARPSASTVDALCGLTLHAKRLGLEVELRNVSDELHQMLAFAGLCEVCGCSEAPVDA